MLIKGMDTKKSKVGGGGVEKERVLVGRMLRRCVAIARAGTQREGGTLA
jgi:hypothetical protein